MRRRDFITALVGTALAWPLSARAQQAGRKARIGVLMGISDSDPEAGPRVEAFQKGLQDLELGRALRTLGQEPNSAFFVVPDVFMQVPHADY